MTKAQFKKLKVGDEVRLLERVEVGKQYRHLILYKEMVDELPAAIIEIFKRTETVRAGKLGYWYTRQMIMPV